MLQPPTLEYYCQGFEGTESEELGSPGNSSLMGLSSSDGCYSVMELEGLVQSGDYLYPNDEGEQFICAPSSDAGVASITTEDSADDSLATPPPPPPSGRRHRSPKKPIPEDLKDVKYCERRKRNNLAAKKSRDARKQRAMNKVHRQDCLEMENAQLREEVKELRRDVSALRELLSARLEIPAEGGAATSLTPLPPMATVASLMPVKMVPKEGN